MAEYGFYRLEHSSFGKSDERYQPGMLAQHAVYVSRLSASDHCITVNFSTNTHKFRREVAEYEQSVTRKNARLIDKIVINLDARMDNDARDEAVRSFLISITKGRARARADFHLGDGHNPHVHIVFVDNSVHDGKKVQHLSDSPRDRAKKGLEPNGTEWLRQAWEKDCNAVLEGHGYEFRIYRRSRLERGLEAAKEHVEWRAGEEPSLKQGEVPLETNPLVDVPLVTTEPECPSVPLEQVKETDLSFTNDEISKANDTNENAPGTIIHDQECDNQHDINAQECPQTPLEPEQPKTTLAPQECKMSKLEKDYLAGLSPDELPAPDADYITRDVYESNVQRVEDALEADTEYQRLKHIQSEVERLKEAAEQSARQAEAAQRKAGELFKQAQWAAEAKEIAEERLAPLQREDGRLKGWHLKLGPLEVKFPKRVAAEKALTAAERAQSILKVREKNHQDALHAAAVEAGNAERYARQKEAEELAMVNHIHEVYGEDKTLKDAEYLHVKSVSMALADVDPGELYAEFENGSVTAEQAKRAFELMGEEAYANMVEQRAAIEEEMDPRGSYTDGLEM